MMGLISDINLKMNHIHCRPRRFGKIASVVGTVIEATGLNASVGQQFHIHNIDGTMVEAQAVGVRGKKTLLMPLDQIEGLQAGCLIEPSISSLFVPAGKELLGRVLNANAQPIDSKGPVNTEYRTRLHKDPPDPLTRRAVRDVLTTGVRAIDTFTSLGKGQRLGIFAGSGVGKSVLMGMIARNSSADVNVIALIGERGREVREFVEDILGPEGLKRSVVIATTSDKAAMSRVKAAYTATAIAEYFRDQGNDVLLMMDSVTRVAMAQREIGLASGEPPTTKGYTPSVFAMLPRLLERACTSNNGSITGLYTVLVDNDDMNEPIADAVRSILDGHIVLSRKLAHQNHFPAIDVLHSVSRVMNNMVDTEFKNLANNARELLSAYRDAEDLIQIGAYTQGSDARIDMAVKKIDALNSFLKQGETDSSDSENCWNQLASILGNDGGKK